MLSRFREGPLAAIVVAAVLVAMSLGARAQQPEAAPASPRFDINRYEITGNTLLKPGDVVRIVAPFTGKQKDFADVQHAIDALEAAYRGTGYGAVQAQLPEQDITTGVVTITIIEPRIGNIVLEGNQHFDAANVRRGVPALREGVTPNSHAIARNLALANENPAKQTAVLMRPGGSDDKVDMTVRVTDNKPWKASLTADNTGTTQTGDYRVTFGYQHANLFNRDHVLSLQYVTSPAHYADVKVYGAGYRIPLYALGSSLDFIGGYSNVNSGTVAGLFTVSGAGTVVGARYNQFLPRLGDIEQKLVFGADYRSYQNSVLAGGTNLVPDITVHPLSLTYQGTLRGDGYEAGVYAGAVQNVFPGDNDGADTDFKAQRADAKAGYRLYRYGANFTRALPRDWQARAAVTGQHTQDALVPGEQFGIGGPDSVRGFLVRGVANDRGYQGNVELYTPDLAAVFKWTNAHGRLLAFYDWGTLKRNSPQPGELSGQSVDSAGLGMRFNVAKNFSARVDYARVLHGTGTENTGHTRVHMSFSIIY